jgi:hypothetical protein
MIKDGHAYLIIMLHILGDTFPNHLWNMIFKNVLLFYFVSSVAKGVNNTSMELYWLYELIWWKVEIPFEHLQNEKWMKVLFRTFMKHKWHWQLEFVMRIQNVDYWHFTCNLASFQLTPTPTNLNYFCTFECSVEPRSNPLFIVIASFVLVSMNFLEPKSNGVWKNGYQVVTFNVTIFKIAPFEINQSINL